MSTNVDLELLAEHLEGALAGTPEEARVAELVATDPEWARAAAELSDALAAVAADLRTLPPPSLPEDVAARLDAVLRDQPAPAPAPGRPRLHERPADRRPASVRAEPGPGRPRRRRLAQWGAGIAVAAGIAAFAAFGLGSWLSESGGFTGFTGGGDDSGGAAEAPQDAGGDGTLSAAQPLLTASGTDYSPSTLAGARAPTIPLEEDAAPAEGTDRPPAAAPNQDESFAQLRSQPALAACLDAVTATVEPAPSTIDVVDFASFQGEPALVIWLTTADGAQWAWVAGPDCGTAGAADIQFGTPLS